MKCSFLVKNEIDSFFNGFKLTIEYPFDLQIKISFSFQSLSLTILRRLQMVNSLFDKQIHQRNN